MTQNTSYPLVLVILDGFGCGDDVPSNAIGNAKTPNFDRFLKENPFSKLVTNGPSVGLPEGVMGNSEVGHLTLGAGRVIYQDLSKINKAVESGEFTENTEFKRTIENLKTSGGRLHLLGLFSNAGVHSDMNHFYPLCEMANRENIKTYIHAFTDGRDTSPTSGKDFAREFISKIPNNTDVASIAGRFYAMDRDNRWDRIEKAFRVLMGQTDVDKDLSTMELPQVFEYLYEKGRNGEKETDEFIIPTLLKKEGAIAENDAVIFINFRADRAREISKAINGLDNFSEFERNEAPIPSSYICMTEYDEKFNLPVAFPKVSPSKTMGEIISSLGEKQLRLAETEKYAHVTYFFNGGDEKVFDGEERKLIPSPKHVQTYDEIPEMSAPKVTEEAVLNILSKNFRFILINFANCDMVGHTGDFDAAKSAVEYIDSCLGKIEAATKEAGYHLLITADHGNVELMEKDGSPFTQHTLNKVPFVWIAPNAENTASLSDGTLADVSPTALDLMNIEIPSEMTGKSLRS
jgi:2,3-bisphosphoglycerate-independent phosphoglycerate mutase